MIQPERGDIYIIEILKGETQGRELIGPHAWVVLSIKQLNERLEIFTAVPLTSIINKSTGKPKDEEGAFRYFRKRILPYFKKADPGVDSPILKNSSLALPEQIRVFSSRRLTHPRLGIMMPEGLAAIDLGLAFVQGRGIGRQIIDAPAAKTTELPRPMKMLNATAKIRRGQRQEDQELRKLKARTKERNRLSTRTAKSTTAERSSGIPCGNHMDPLPHYRPI